LRLELAAAILGVEVRQGLPVAVDVQRPGLVAAGLEAAVGLEHVLVDVREAVRRDAEDRPVEDDPVGHGPVDGGGVVAGGGLVKGLGEGALAQAVVQADEEHVGVLDADAQLGVVAGEGLGLGEHGLDLAAGVEADAVALPLLGGAEGGAG
jgi:hypothetical protein